MGQPTEVVFLTCGNDLGRIAARRLSAAFPGVKIMVERPVPRSQLLRRRIKHFGLLRVAGQVAFILFSRVLAVASRRRIAAIQQQFQLEARWPEGCERIDVASVNSPELRSRTYKPIVKRRG